MSDVYSRVPVRTILATIGLVLAAVVAVFFVMQVQQVLTWIVVALFFAVALYPVVNFVERRAVHRRSLATLLVYLLVVVILGALLAAFAVPLATQGTQLAGQLPGLVDQARSGSGPIGSLLERTNALQFVQNNEDRIRQYAEGLGGSALGLVQGIGTGVVATVTIFVLSYLMVLEGPKTVDGSLALFSPHRAERIRRVSRDCAKTITGYISGNLLISAICGVLTYAVLAISGVPFAALIALFVAIADLIPLVGATLGAVVACVAAFIHSVPAGIAAVIFFIVYQQLENHLLQPMIFARTVKVNPLAVLIAILLATQLAGILGALLAIPIAGIIQVILRDVWDHRRGAPKAEPTVGEDRVPVDSAGPDDTAAPAPDTATDGRPLTPGGRLRKLGDAHPAS